MEHHDPSIPVIFSGFGCGSLPAMRDFFHDPALSSADIEKKLGFCSAILQKGGICGGTGIIFSRAAVQKLFSEGRDAFWRRVYGLSR